MGRCKRTKYYTEEDVSGHTCNYQPTTKKFINLEGKVFSELVVMKLHKRSAPHTYWFCKCSCGNIVSASTNQLNRGKSCCTDCSMKTVGDSKLKGKDYFINILNEKYPSYECKDSKEGKSVEYWLWYCNKCVTPFYARPTSLQTARDVVCLCNNTKFSKWNSSLRERQILEVCADRGLRFLGWKDEYTGNTSRVFVKCSKHPHYEITVSNLVTNAASYGCPHCADDRKGDTLRHDSSLIKEKGLELFKGKYSYDNFNYVCSRTPSEVFCNDCSLPFDVSYDNHINKQRGCPYEKGRSQQELYIQQILDNGLPLCVKFGIAVNSTSRMKEHDSATIYETLPLKVYKFPDPLSCKKAENIIKKTTTRSFLSKEEFPTGNTETTSISNIEAIEDICIDMGGVIL